MTTDVKTPPPPKVTAASAGRAGRSLSRLVTWPARLSLAARAALVVAVCLAGLVVLVFVLIRMNRGYVSLYHVLTWQRGVAAAVLLLLIPLVVYKGLKLWLEGESSEFPEIDYAWRAGIAALRTHGLDIQSLPLFLILGPSSPPQEQAIAVASGRSFRLDGVPEGPAPLHWYASPDAIYLVCSEVGSLSALAALARTRPEPPVEQPRMVLPTGGGDTISVRNFLEEQPEPPRPPGVLPGGEGDSAFRRPGPSRQAAAHQGTMTFDDAFSVLRGAGHTPEERRAAPVAPEQPVVLSPRSIADQTRRLHYVARLLARTREPLCPVNGILTLLPFSMIRASQAEAEQLERAVHTDLTTLQRTLHLRCPVTALVAGLEDERGFSELVRRVGRERSAAQRFGRGFNLRSAATTEELAALTSHVCGAFEDWIYTLFREQGALTRPGNTRLYALLCKVRCQLQERLSEILTKGFGHDPGQPAADDAVLFSGCYFAATGESEDRQAFVRAIFDKLEGEQEELEWTPDAIAADRRHRRLAGLAIALNVVLLISLVAMVVYRSL